MMMHLAYFIGLTVSLAGLTAIDRRYSLALWHDARATIITLAVSVGYFLAWDLIGIRRGIFFHGTSRYDTGWLILPNLPVEEILFLTLLSYVTLIIYRGFRCKTTV